MVCRIQIPYLPKNTVYSRKLWRTMLSMLPKYFHFSYSSLLESVLVFVKALDLFDASTVMVYATQLYVAVGSIKDSKVLLLVFILCLVQLFSIFFQFGSCICKPS